jgi:DNA repair protein RadC
MDTKSSLYRQKTLIALHMDKKEPHFLGHRARVKEKFLKSPSSLQDYELLELALFWALPRKDTKPLAKQMLSDLKNLAGIIYADPDKLLSVEGANQGMLINFMIIREFLDRVLKQNVINTHVLSSWNALVEYLQTTMGSIKTEQFRIIFLNSKNIIVADEIQSVGTVDQTSIYPREVVKRALFHESTAIILVHNHPSGDPKPSRADIELTKEVVQACLTFNIKVHDHVIISKRKFFSFKSECLL